MISKKNLIALASLGLCGVVWIPQVLNMTSPDPSNAPTPHVEEEDEDDEPFASSADEEEDPVAELIDGKTEAGPKELLEGTEQLLGRMEAFAGGPAGLDLKQLVQVMEQRSVQPSTSVSTGSIGGSGAVARTSSSALRDELERSHLRELLATFAEENELTGILAGATGASALLGHRVVRPGDRLGGGHIVVAEIDRNGVLLESESESLFLELPPFVARGRAQGSGGDEETLDEMPTEPEEGSAQ